MTMTETVLTWAHFNGIFFSSVQTGFIDILLKVGGNEKQ